MREQPPQSEVSSPESRQEHRSLFRRLAHSDLARIIAFMTALGVGSSYLAERSIQKEGEQLRWSQEHREELQARGREVGERPEPAFRFSDTVEDFESGVIIPGEQSVVHIEQTHGSNSFVETQEHINLQEVIDYQKGLEGLFLWFRDHEHIRTFFVEGFAQEYATLLTRLKEAAMGSASPIDRMDACADIASGISQESEKDIPGSVKAWALYQCAVLYERELLRLDAYAADYQQEKSVPDEYRSIFLQWETDGNSIGQEMSDRAKTGQAIRHYPAINGDNIYHWGAAEKLWIEGEIDIVSAETFEANRRSLEVVRTSPMTKEEFTNPDKRAEAIRMLNEKARQRDEIRDSTAVSIIAQDRSDGQKLYPLIFGGAHSFRDNVERYNEEHPDRPLGLIRVWENDEVSVHRSAARGTKEDE